MTDRIWLKNYPAGVPGEIDPDQFQSIGDLIEKTCAKFAARPSYHNLGLTGCHRGAAQLRRADACHALRRGGARPFDPLGCRRRSPRCRTRYDDKRADSASSR